MKYIKIFESEIKRTFSEWLKNPKKPEEKVEPKTHIFMISGEVLTTLSDNGDFTTNDILDYTDLWDEFSKIVKRPVDELKNSDDIDDEFEKYLIKVYEKNVWYRFLKDHLEDTHPIDEDNIDDFKSELKKLNPKFENDEAWFRVYSTDIIDSELSKYSIKSKYGSVYFKLEISRDLNNEEEKDWIEIYIDDIIGKLCEKVRKEKRYIEHHGRYRGESRFLMFDREYSWHNGVIQVYPTT